jgi:pimeloyl-ACP methyl ester carboxylesterase
MSSVSGYIQAGNFKLHYLKIGSGPKLAIAFHGYGNEASIFTPLGKYIGNEYTMYSIDLPHHGRSKSGDGTFEKNDVIALVDNLKKEMNVSKASLLGYSIGGRVALTIVELMPEQIDKVVLMASDGLRFNPLYYFLTSTYAGGKLFRHFLTKPEKYFPFIDWLKRRNIIDKHRHSFAMWYLQTESTRTFLLKVWPNLRKLVPNSRRVRAAIEKYELPMHVCMGKHDKIIKPKLADGFKRNLKTVHLYILDKGHRVLDQDTLPQIAACLL